MDEIKISPELEEIKQNNEENQLKASNFEQKYVYDVYEKIAPHFSNTRYKPWPKIATFLNSLPIGSLVADIGCGNGKYINTNQENIFMIGTDRSQNLLKIARDKFDNSQVFSADSLKLPLRSQSFDYAISIAVVHHFSNKLAAVNEILRILKVNGIVLIYVWAFEQKERHFTEQDIFVPWHLPFKYENDKVIENLSTQAKNTEEDENQKNEQFINEEKQTVVYKRYYHVFKKGELEELLNQIPDAKIIESYYDHANWCCKLKKLK